MDPSSSDDLPRVDVTVNVASGSGVPVPDADDLLQAAVLHVLDREGVADGELSVTLLDDEEIRALNRQYLSRDRATDVIAFSLGDDEGLMGDVYVGLEQARRQAEALGIGVEEELVRLAVHGTLHVLGYDHPEGEDREVSPMYRLQERLVQEVLDRR